MSQDAIITRIAKIVDTYRLRGVIPSVQLIAFEAGCTVEEARAVLAELEAAGKVRRWIPERQSA